MPACVCASIALCLNASWAVYAEDLRELQLTVTSAAYFCIEHYQCKRRSCLRCVVPGLPLGSQGSRCGVAHLRLT